MPKHDLSDEQVAEFREAFLLFDKDGDGTITTKVRNFLLVSSTHFPLETTNTVPSPKRETNNRNVKTGWYRAKQETLPCFPLHKSRRGKGRVSVFPYMHVVSTSHFTFQAESSINMPSSSNSISILMPYFFGDFSVTVLLKSVVIIPFSIPNWWWYLSTTYIFS